MRNKEKTLQKKERIKWIDAVRAGAVLCVILCHCTEGIYKIDATHLTELSWVSEVFAVVCFTVGRLGVPFFLMISGYLLLDRTYTDRQCRMFWKNKWLHLLLCTEIWIVIYRIFLSIYGNHEVNWGVMLEEMLFVREASVSHLWYMSMILGVYLLVPIAANALKITDVRMLRFPLVIYAGYAFGYPFIAALYQILDIKHSLNIQFSFGFSGGAYGIYFLLGYLVKKGWFSKCKIQICAAAAVLSFGITVIFQLWSFSEGYTYKLWYTFPALCLCTLAIFEMLSRIKNVVFYKVIHFISYYSFAAYLIHNIFRRIAVPFMRDLPLAQPIKVIVLYILVVFLSFPTVCLINRIPKIGKYILYTK